MLERPFRNVFADSDDWRRAADADRAELAAFFRGLGLGWEVDPEVLIDRLADPRDGR